MPRSISARMALTWSFLLLLVTTFGIASSLLGARKLIQQDYHRAGRELANLAALVAAEYLSAGKPEALAHIVETVSVGNLSVTDATGKVIAGGNRGRSPLGSEFRAVILSPEGRTVG